MRPVQITTPTSLPAPSCGACSQPKHPLERHWRHVESLYTKGYPKCKQRLAFFGRLPWENIVSSSARDRVRALLKTHRLAPDRYRHPGQRRRSLRCGPDVARHVTLMLSLEETFDVDSRTRCYAGAPSRASTPSSRR